MRRMRMSTWLASTVAVAAALAVGAATLTPGAVSAQPKPQPDHHASQVSVTYTADHTNIANPARGFYHVADTHYLDAKGAGWTPMDGAELRSWRAEGITQVLREVYLEHFGGADGAWNLTPDLLRKIDADFATARRAGVKVILRFAYTLPPDGVWPPPTPYGDAPVARTLHHIRQLGPVLRRNADVIETVQQGFIGLWGEGYYSDYFSDPADPSIVTDQNWADRARVLRTLLDQLPKSVTVQERTMYMKQRILGVPTGAGGALTPAQAFSGSDLSRVGFHNDCFLASPDDYGTFLSDPLSLDENYLALDSRYVPVGGETCNVNPPKSEWPSARLLMERFHYSYLNTEYNQDVLDTWGTAGYAEAAKRLGYRFTLLHGTFSKQVVAGRKLHVDLAVRTTASPRRSRSGRSSWFSSGPSTPTGSPCTPTRGAGRPAVSPRCVRMSSCPRGSGRVPTGSPRAARRGAVATAPGRLRDPARRRRDLERGQGWNELGATVEVHSHR